MGFARSCLFMDLKPFNDIGTIAILSEGVYTPKEAKRIYPLDRIYSFLLSLVSSINLIIYVITL